MHHLRMSLFQKLRGGLHKIPRYLRVLLLAVLSIVVAVVVLPWGSWAGKILRNELAERGIILESFELESLSFNGAHFRNLHITAPASLEIPKLELSLSTAALFQGEWNELVSHITISNMLLELEATEDAQWKLNGKLLPKSADDVPAKAWQDQMRDSLALAYLFPEVDGNEIYFKIRQAGKQFGATVNFSTQRLAQGIGFSLGMASAELVELTGGSKVFSLPDLKLNGEWNKEARSLKATANAETLEWTQGDQSFSAKFDFTVAGYRDRTSSAQVKLSNVHYAVLGGVKAAAEEVTLNATAPNGYELESLTLVFAAPALQLENVPAHLTALSVHAVCNADDERLLCNRLVISTPTGAINATGMAALELSAPEKVNWTLHGAANNMLGGRFRFEAGSVAAGGIDQAKIQIMADRLALQEVLSLLAEGKIAATGTVSGQIPLSWHGASDIRFGRGSLSADGRGSIRIAPELLAMDNEQMAMVSGILQDFHYEQLSIRLSPEGGKKGKLPGLKASLSTLGKNPTKLDGHPVKLNVNLSGDLLSVLKQSILPMSDPQQWLQNQK